MSTAVTAVNNTVLDVNDGRKKTILVSLDLSEILWHVLPCKGVDRVVQAQLGACSPVAPSSLSSLPR